METSPKELVKEHLKVLLAHFARTTDNPGAALEDILHEVIEELYVETERALRERSSLKLVVDNR